MTDEPEDARYENPPDYHGVEAAPGMKESEEPPEIDSGESSDRDRDECPRCGNQGHENPVLDDWYECSTCVIAFNADGEVSTDE